MTAGEFPLALVYAFNIAELHRSGAPVGWVTSAKPIVATTSGVGISAKTDAPASNKLFIDFALSAEGREAYCRIRTFFGAEGRTDYQRLENFRRAR